MQQVELLLPNSKETVSLSFFWRWGGGELTLTLFRKLTELPV